MEDILSFCATNPELMLYVGGAIAFYTVLLIMGPQLKRWENAAKDRRREYDEKVLKRALNEALPGAEWLRGGAIKPSVFYDYGIIPNYDRYCDRGMMRYQRNGTEYFCCNLLLRRERIRKGEEEVETVYTGRAYSARYRNNLPGAVRIVTVSKVMPVGYRAYSSYPSKRKQETEIETENIRFNRIFRVYATDRQSAFFVLTPVVMEQLLLMQEHYRQMGIYISGGQIVVTLETNHFLFPERSYKKEREAQDIQAAKEEAKRVAELAGLLEDTLNGSIQNNFTQIRKDGREDGILDNTGFDISDILRGIPFLGDFYQ